MSHFIRTETELSSVPTLSGVAKSQNTESQNTGPLPKARVNIQKLKNPSPPSQEELVSKRARSQNTECNGKGKKKAEYRIQNTKALCWETELGE